MAVIWSIEKYPTSGDTDFEAILDSLETAEEEGRDLEYVIPQGGHLILFFKKKP